MLKEPCAEQGNKPGRKDGSTHKHRLVPQPVSPRLSRAGAGVGGAE